MGPEQSQLTRKGCVPWVLGATCNVTTPGLFVTAGKKQLIYGSSDRDQNNSSAESTVSPEFVLTLSDFPTNPDVQIFVCYVLSSSKLLSLVWDCAAWTLSRS